MIELHTLKPSQSRHRYKRVGRGNASGKGTTAGRGTKGQRARTGGRNKLTRRGLKHLIERTPKNRGFLSLRPRMGVVTLLQLNSAFSDGQQVTADRLHHLGMIGNPVYGYKVIGQADFKKKLTVKANKFSAGAAAAITKAGGQAVVLTPKPTETKQPKSK